MLKIFKHFSVLFRYLPPFFFPSHFLLLHSFFLLLKSSKTNNGQARRSVFRSSRGLYFGQIKSDLFDFGVIQLSLMCSTFLVQTDHFYLFFKKLTGVGSK
uniref:Uncharacterized protein n=1 Tax=Meloidogyne enterolobii TaxID=390850 RepID=A0A6V7TJK5_MELEN|nr:unnamed protein product [Meloidogyne enterolobii]